MGSRTYDFLADSFLFHDRLVSSAYASLTERELAKELQRYRDFCLANRDALISEVLAYDSSLRVFSGLDRVRLSMLKRCALYVHQYIIDDPLIPLSAEKGEFTEAIIKLKRLKSESLDRQDLAARVRFLKELTPMVSADFVKLLPISYAFEPPKELPFLYSETGFSDALPRALMEIFSANAKVRSVKGNLIMSKLYPCRDISVTFHDCPHCMGYTLFENRVTSLDEKTRTAGFAMTVPDAPPELSRFKAWVNQSVNQTALRVHNWLMTELAFAAQFGAVYSTQSELVCELLNTVLPTNGSIPVETANTFLNLELPFLADVDAGTLMRLRTQEGEAFQNFRIQLEKQMRDLRLESDPDKARIKAENAVHELTEVQVREVGIKLASVKEKAGWTAALATTGFMAAVQTSGVSLLAAAAAAVTGAQAALEYRKEVKRHPAFFMWKLRQEAKRKTTQ